MVKVPQMTSPYHSLALKSSPEFFQRSPQLLASCTYLAAEFWGTLFRLSQEEAGPH